jgi:para-aminobenzoate synthetase component 1
MAEHRGAEGEAAPRAAVVPLVEELSAGLDAWQVCQRLARLPHVLFLDSAAVLPELGRYSFVTADPFAWLTCSRGRVVLDGRQLPVADPFPVLADLLARWRAQTLADLPPFQAGVAGLFGYDLCHHLERLPRPRFDEFRVPDLAVGCYDWVVGFDHVRQRAWLVSTGFPETKPQRRRLRAEGRLGAVKACLSGAGRADHAPPVAAAIRPALAHAVPSLPGVCSNFTRGEYLAAVRRAIDYVHAGDCFQVNLAQRLLHPATPPLGLYQRLRERNPAPFAGYFDVGDCVIASASPERFLRVEGGRVETRPIKGTRPRGGTPDEDERLREELAHSAKDRAENIMIIDLLRNDLGRVCAYGSVEVAAVCRLETHPYVHHLVSEVRGCLRSGLGPVDLLRAAFPGGSVTGAPKVRAMEIIAELEPTARGPYCGSLGCLGFDGSMDTNILIRTFTAGGGWLQFPVGGGVVADSTPEGEYEETLHKAAGLAAAIEVMGMRGD